MGKKNYKIIFEQLKKEKDTKKVDFFYPQPAISDEELDEINEIIKLSNELEEPDPQYYITTT